MKIRLWREVQVGTDENGEPIYSGPLFEEIERLRGALETIIGEVDGKNLTLVENSVYELARQALEGETK